MGGSGDATISKENVSLSELSKGARSSALGTGWNVRFHYKNWRDGWDGKEN